MDELLFVKGLRVSYRNENTILQAINNLDLRIGKGEVIAVLGETGCGKSTLAKSLVSLVPNVEAISCTEFNYRLKNGEKVSLGYNSQYGFEQLRGKEIGIVYQEAPSHLNPNMVCSKQLLESLHQIDLNEKKERLVEVLASVGFLDIDRILKAYPHQLSGGEKQRVLLAMAALQKPSLLLVDEPTSSLDKPNEQLVVSYLKQLNQLHGTAILFITHDIGLAISVADKIKVMKDGKIVDEFLTKSLEGLDSYTEMLFDKWNRISKGQPNSIPINTRKKILETSNLRVEYDSSYGRSLFFAKKHMAVNHISMELYEQEALGVFGVSGSGKTSLARALCGLEDIRFGELWVNKEYRVQMVFQDPNGSLDPLQKVGDAILEVLKQHNPNATKEMTVELLSKVKLLPDTYDQYPRALSGGQKQRVCIARALASQPKIIIFDEATSSLDAPIKTEILELLMALKDDLGLTYIIITHDFSVIKFMATRVLVMNEGEIVEEADTTTIVNNPIHPVTKTLILQEEHNTKVGFSQKADGTKI